MTGPINIALVYDDEGYTERLRAPDNPSPGQPMGLMGRQVAGKEFLDAYLSHGTWTELVALVQRRQSVESLARLCHEHLSSRTRQRRLIAIDECQFHRRFFPQPPAPLLYTPHPPDTRFAWARQHGGPTAFALCGVTHTLSSAPAVNHLCQLVTTPYESYDALICTSQAVLRLVQTVTGTYADYLRERHGGSPGVRLRLAMIPLGVDPAKFRPPTPEERSTRRQALGIRDDEVVVLFVGRLSHHAKAHPFPLFHGVDRAARQTGRKVHLVMCGWASNAAVQKAFEDGARVFAPGVRVSFVDNLTPDLRHGIWHVADVFASLVDNIQETFGLVIVEAMASGLPVVATDWNGYRDLVADGVSGLLVPTWMVRDAGADATSKLIVGELNYDHFLAEYTQTVGVDLDASAAAFTRLIGDESLRREMGSAGRQRVIERFTWAKVIAAYEDLWRSQEDERQAQAKLGAAVRPYRGPACFPSPDHSFAVYPTQCLDDKTRLCSIPQALGQLHALLTTALTTHAAESRVTDSAVLQRVLAAAGDGRTVAELDIVLAAAGAEHVVGRTTLAWLLKYGLLRCVQ